MRNTVSQSTLNRQAGLYNGTFGVAPKRSTKNSKGNSKKIKGAMYHYFDWKRKIQQTEEELKEQRSILDELTASPANWKEKRRTEIYEEIADSIRLLREGRKMPTKPNETTSQKEVNHHARNLESSLKILRQLLASRSFEGVALEHTSRMGYHKREIIALKKVLKSQNIRFKEWLNNCPFPEKKLVAVKNW